MLRVIFSVKFGLCCTHAYFTVNKPQILLCKFFYNSVVHVVLSIQYVTYCCRPLCVLVVFRGVVWLLLEEEQQQQQLVQRNKKTLNQSKMSRSLCSLLYYTVELGYQAHICYYAHAVFLPKSV